MEVASLAVLYLRARLWAVVPGLVMMVGIGAARGHRNMQASRPAPPRPARCRRAVRRPRSLVAPRPHAPCAPLFALGVSLHLQPSQHFLRSRIPICIHVHPGCRLPPTLCAPAPRPPQAPLYGSLAYLLALGALDTWLVLGARWGVEGAGAAAAGAQWVGAAAVVGAMSSRGELRPRHLLAPPRPAAALPYLRTFPSLALNSMAALAPMLAGTSLATSLGPGPLAAHTVLRQISTFWLQGFLAFNATAHSMAASALGGRDAPRAGAELLARVAALAVACSLPLAAGLFAVRASLPGVFTGDEAVGAEVLRVLPLLLAAMPLDALGTALEGGILGAADTRWVATRTALASAVSLAALGAAGAGGGGLPAIWCALKVVSVGALALDLSKFLGPAAREARAATALRKRRPG